METICRVFVLGMTAIMLTGCPIGLNYPAGEPGQMKIDPRLLGTWEAADTEAEVQQVRISVASPFQYKTEVIETGVNYAADCEQFDSWLTQIGEHLILVSRCNSDPALYYHYHLTIEGNKVIIRDISLLDGGVDAVTSQESLRKQMETSIPMEEGLSAPFEYFKME